MKQIITLVIIACSLNTYAQWTKLQSGTSRDLNDIFFASDNVGWAVGKDGAIRKTTNGGNTWSGQTSPVSEDLNGVYFISSLTGWACGKEGYILKTTDGGTTWNQQASAAADDLYAIYFYSNDNGIAVGKRGIVVTTTDGGSTWTTRTSGTASDLVAVQMLNFNTIYACGEYGKLIKSEDGGATWVSKGASSYYHFTGMHFLSASKAYFTIEVRDEDLTPNNMFSYDGTTLTPITANTSKTLRAVHFINNNEGWVVGEEGRILHTSNGGSSWTAQTNTSVEAELTGLHFTNVSNGFTSGEDGTILKLGSVVGINEVAFEGSVNIYPNPASNNVQVKIANGTASEYAVTIYDNIGKQVYSSNAGNNDITNINIAELATGVYTLEVKAGVQKQTSKLIKQ